MILKRASQCNDGVFSQLIADTGERLAWTLEHAYLEEGKFKSKIPLGEYVCVRGIHHLERTKTPFETFEITGVEGHKGLLFHIGCFQRDSDGCVLVGRSITQFEGHLMITDSRQTFEKFMSGLKETHTFSLKVI